MSQSLLKTKLYIPQTRPQLVPRPHLLERLNQGVRGKLIVVSAPPGFGKSTLITTWIDHFSKNGTGNDSIQPVDFAWVSLDELDNDPVRFWTYVFAALETVQPALTTDANTLLHDPQTPSIEISLTALINAVVDASYPVVLVLDDYHLIESEAIHQALTFLLDHLPPQLCLIMTTRTDPPLSLNRLRVRHLLTEVRESDLRFSPTEVAMFLNQIMDLNLSVADVSALETRTEGWIAGLQLAALALQAPLSVQNQGDSRDFVQAFTGSHRYVIDYLAEEVLAQQPEHIREFLLKTSLLERLSGPLCDAVLGREMIDVTDITTSLWQATVPDATVSSQDILNYLDQANLFLIPLDAERRWYRYHHLFADFLREHLRHLVDQAELDALNNKASQWFAAYDSVTEAVSYALLAHNPDLAANLLEQVILPHIIRGEVSTMLSWLRQLPEDIVKSRPRLSLGWGWIIIIMNQLDDIEQWVEASELGLARLKADSTVDTAVSAEQIQELEGELAAMQAMLIAMDDKNLPQAIELSAQALTQLGEDSYLAHSVLNMNMGNIYLRLNNLEQASQRLTQAITYSKKTPENIITAMFASHSLGNIEEEKGQLHQAKVYHRQAVEYATGSDGKPLSLAALGYLGLAEVQRKQNLLAEATANVKVGMTLAEQGQQLGGIQVGQIILARVLQAQGDTTGALSTIKIANTVALDILFEREAWVRAVQTRLWLAQGDLINAAHWADTSALPMGNDFNYMALPGEYTTLVRVYIAQERFDEASKLLEQALLVAEAGKLWGRVLEITMLQALTRYAQGNPERALAPLTRALSLGEQENYIRVFVDEGPAMAQLLNFARAKDVPHQAYIDKLLLTIMQEKTESSITAVKVRQNTPHPSLISTNLLIEPLSEREKEVLRLIADGFSNREVAEQLFITVGTAKTHANNIYRKLDVRSRTQAVARATELGVL